MDGNVLLSRRVKVTVNGKPYLVEVAGSLTSSPINVKVNGQPYMVDLASTETEANEKSAAALDSVARETSVPSKTPLPPGPAGPIVPNVKAPMPGNLIEVLAKVGDRVKYGQSLCTLEAMKMKNSIRSPRDGVIATVEASVGETVAYGQVLMTFQVDGQAEGA
jgi:biotin carboxyl carrier protein